MKFSFVLFILMLCSSIFAQSNFNKLTPQLNDVLNASSAGDELLVWVFFYDKGEDLSYYLNNPQSVVSEKSLKRRSKVLPPSGL